MRFQNEHTYFYKSILTFDRDRSLKNVKVLAKWCLICCAVVHDCNVQMYEKMCPFTIGALKGHMSAVMH